MQIKELARATGVDVETIRYYEKQGLLPEPARRDNGYRDYAAEHLERLSFIRHCRALDMPLADVNRLLGFVDLPSADCSDVDLLVEFEPGARITLLDMAQIEIELSTLLGGRKVDLRTAGDLSRFFRDEVVRTAEPQYVAG